MGIIECCNYNATCANLVMCKVEITCHMEWRIIKYYVPFDILLWVHFGVDKMDGLKKLTVMKSIHEVVDEVLVLVEGLPNFVP